MYFALLDLLRFFSAIGVLFHHTFVFHYGKLGVYLFFIISGFVIHFSLKKGLKDYVVSRFLRLFPLFWVCCTITYLVTVFYGVNLPIKNYLISMLLINDGKIASMVDGSYWTLTFELLFYFYIGVFVWIFSTERLIWFYLLWTITSVSCFFFGVDQNIIAKLLCVRFVPYFVFGGVLALIVENYETVALRMKFLYGTLLFSAALLPIYVSEKLREQKDTISNFTGSFEPDELKVLLTFFVLVPLIVYLSRFRFANTKRFTEVSLLLGGVTYPIYLLHWKMGETIINGQGFHYGKVGLFSSLVVVLMLSLSQILAMYDLDIRKIVKKKIMNL